jgi:hypothetical protein
MVVKIKPKSKKDCKTLRLKNVNDIVGKTFGKLKVLSFDRVERKQYNGYHVFVYYYEVECECGSKYVTDRGYLLGKYHHSCGCDRKADLNDIIGKQMGPWYVESYDHLDTATHTHFYKCIRRDGSTVVVSRSNIIYHAEPLYRKYHSMKDRCLRKNSSKYPNYGGRGIKICDHWLGENGFIHFREDMYESYLEHCKLYGEGNTTLDRIDVNGDYCPENCRWATWEEQENNKTTNYMVFYNGERLSLADCIRKYANKELSYSTIQSRLFDLGWGIYRAMQEPNFYSVYSSSNVVCPLIFRDNII